MTRFAPGTSQATMDAVNQRMYGPRPPVMRDLTGMPGMMPGMRPQPAVGMPDGRPSPEFQRSPQANGLSMSPPTDVSAPKPAYASPSISPRPPMGGYGGMMGMGLGQMFGMGGGYGQPPMPPQYGGGYGGGFPGMMGYGRPPIPSQMNPFGFGGGFGGGYGRPPMPQYGGFGMGFGGGFGGYQPQPQPFGGYGGYGGYGGMRNQDVNSAQRQYQPQMQPPQQSPFGSPMRMY